MNAPINPNLLDSDRVYLKRNVKFEPLVQRWYAWSHLMSPVQMALHVNFRLIPLLQSFATNPGAHIAANSNPAMYGGPFMSLQAEDVPAVANLAKQTAEQCADLITLASDLKAFSESLQEKANGYSLNEYYAALPPTLKGRVELLYDTNHRPQIRFFEDLLSGHSEVAAAQEILLEEVAEHDRHFFMSTPRLDRDDNLSLKIKFDDKRLDALAAFRTEPGSLSDIAKLLEVPEASLATFRNFFTTDAPARNGLRDHQQDGVRMRFFGHACVLFQTKDVAVLFDPFVAIEDETDGRFTINDLPEHIDYVVITHNHHDHFNPEMLIQLRRRIGCIIVPQNNSGAIADPSMKLNLRALGFRNVRVVDQFDQVDIPGGHILSLPFTGEHADLNIYSKHAISLQLAGRNFLFLIDSDGRDITLYHRLIERIGPIDALFIGMECQGAPLNWLYEPLLFKPINRRINESRRLSGADCARAAAIIEATDAPRVFVYAMGQDPWMKYVMGLQYEPDSIQLVESEALIAQTNQANIPAMRLVSGHETLF